jgi:hypothetical protein
MPTVIFLFKTLWSWVQTRLFWIVVAALAVTIAILEAQKVGESRETSKSLQQGIDLVQSQNLIVAAKVKTLEADRALLLARSTDLEAAYTATTDALKKTQATLNAVLSASTGPIIIPPLPSIPTPTHPTSVPPLPSAPPTICVLKVGDSVSIEVGELVLRTDLDNFIVSGAAWVENDKGQKLFGGSFSKDKTNFKILGSSLKSEARSSLSIFSFGGAAVFTGKAHWMFGPKFALHLGERLEAGGSVGVGKLDYYGMVDTMWRF